MLYFERTFNIIKHILYFVQWIHRTNSYILIIIFICSLKHLKMCLKDYRLRTDFNWCLNILCRPIVFKRININFKVIIYNTIEINF